ncbi:hypothetical protein MBLNU230_g3364t1 [Neophaeotheca triangularis]
MSEGMKDAMKGSGGGLQQISSSVGEAMAGNSTSETSDNKAGSEASSDLGKMAGSGGSTASDAPMSGGQQGVNQGTGSADHLGIGK